MPRPTPPPKELCGAPITFVGSPSPLPCLSPLLYEWRTYRGRRLTCQYVGLAKDGQHRPFVTYPSVVSNLNANRRLGARLSTHPGPHGMIPYFHRNPWGFRWIHHELEATAHRITRGNHLGERIELRFLATNIPLAKLRILERQVIDLAKRQTLGTSALANDRPSMITRYKSGLAGLDSAWR